MADHGRLDVAVNNAGGSPERGRGRRVAPLQRGDHPAEPAGAAARGAGRQPGDAGAGGAAAPIVNIASVSGLRPSPGTAAYGAAKAGLLSLTQTLAVEWAPKVRVNAVSAGLIATEDSLDHYGGPEGLARVAATVPMRSVRHAGGRRRRGGVPRQPPGGPT